MRFLERVALEAARIIQDWNKSFFWMRDMEYSDLADWIWQKMDAHEEVTIEQARHARYGMGHFRLSTRA